MQKDWSKILNVLIEYIHYRSTNQKEDKSALAEIIIPTLSKDLYLRLEHFVWNKKSSDKVNYYWESFISVKEAEIFFTELELKLAKIEDLMKKKYKPSKEKYFNSRFYAPLKELFNCKNIQAEILQQEQIVNLKNTELEECNLFQIKTLQMTSIKNILENGIDILLESKK